MSRLEDAFASKRRSCEILREHRDNLPDAFLDDSAHLVPAPSCCVYVGDPSGGTRRRTARAVTFYPPYRSYLRASFPSYRHLTAISLSFAMSRLRTAPCASFCA